MAQYRCYVLNADDHVFEVAGAEHPTDDEAITWADGRSRSHRRCAAVELWSRTRLVHRQPCVSAAG